MLDVNGEEIIEGDKLFCIHGWTGIAKKDIDGTLFVEFKKWCGAFARRIVLDENTIRKNDIRKVKEDGQH
jgi:hypothetical protein